MRALDYGLTVFNDPLTLLLCFLLTAMTVAVVPVTQCFTLMLFHINLCLNAVLRVLIYFMGNFNWLYDSTDSKP